MKISIATQRRGFGILEVVIAVGIITLALTAVGSLIIQSRQAFSINKGRLQADMLALEGVELVRNWRDSNWLANPAVAWYRGIYVADGEPNNVYRFRIDISTDPSTGVTTSVTGITDASARLNKSTGRNAYGHWDVATPSTPTPFYRMIETAGSDVDGNGSTDELKVSSIVQWSERGRTHTSRIETYLYDWK